MVAMNEVHWFTREGRCSQCGNETSFYRAERVTTENVGGVLEQVVHWELCMCVHYVERIAGPDIVLSIMGQHSAR